MKMLSLGGARLIWRGLFVDIAAMLRFDYFCSMGKLCLDCFDNKYARAVVAPKSWTVEECDVPEIVPGPECPLCLKEAHEKAERLRVNAANWEETRTWFIAHMKEIPRDREWKNWMLNMLLPQN